ncbi:unannotated protein [freshwater metagenome]|uniref:Unannotated protein n=1 Tax=freshwater metagenome TaxID=449393 RepID=A0A6J6CHC0_9ZZZZ
MEAHKHGPEMNLAERLVKHATGELWPPEVEATEHRKDDCAEDDVVEMRHNKV